MNYSDFELLEYLKENHYAASFENLCILKEGLENGSIVLEAKREEKIEPEKKEVDKEIVEEEPETEEVVDAAAPRVSIVMPVDGSMQISNAGKQVAADAKGNLSVSLTEKNINYLLKSYLVEDCEMSESNYSLLTEDVKIESVKELAMTLFKSVEEKISNIDTSVADRSRGNIKSLDILPALQDTLTKLEAMVERNDNGSQYMKAINTIVKSILYLNQYSNVFKEAYRNKKTVMILKYQSIILSIISSISYIISTVIDYSGDSVKFKDTNINIMEFAPMITLSQFVRSVDSDEFKTIIKDVTIMREFYLEIPVETMSTVLEASGFADSVISGVKNLYSALADNNDKLTNLLYKAAGVIIILLSLRDVFYTIYNMKTKVSDMIGGIQSFAGLNNGGNVLSKLTQFASKFKSDAEFSSDLSKREVESENKKFGNQVKLIQNSSKIEPPEKEPEISQPIQTFGQQPAVDNNDEFVFDF